MPYYNVTQSMKDVLTTQQDSMSEVERLKSDYENKDIHHKMVSEGNFSQATKERETGKPERGYGSILPRHVLEHGTHYLTTTHTIDYQYPFQWSPKEEVRTEESCLLYIITYCISYTGLILLSLVHNSSTKKHICHALVLLIIAVNQVLLIDSHHRYHCVAINFFNVFSLMVSPSHTDNRCNPRTKVQS